METSPHIVGTLAGGAVSYFAMFSLPMLVWHAGGVIPRRQHRGVSFGLLLLGFASAGYAVSVGSDEFHMTWPTASCSPNGAADGETDPINTARNDPHA